MQRKMMGLFAALVAFGAFALVPAMSSAHGLLDTSGAVTTTTAVGSKIVAYNELGAWLRFVKSGGLTIECSEVTMTGTVAANPHTVGGAIQWTIEDVWVNNCPSSLGSTTITSPGLTSGGGTGHWCIKTVPETHNFTFEPHNCGGAGGEFTYISDGCGYTRAANIGGTFTTSSATHGAVTLRMADGQVFTKESGGILCPSYTVLSEFKFELFTDTAATGSEWRNAASIADPVWMT